MLGRFSTGAQLAISYIIIVGHTDYVTKVIDS